MERYKKIEKNNRDATLGEGAYGVVYKAIDLKTNKHVALKKIRVEIEDEGIPTTALREIVLLRQLEHPNVVKLENVVMDPARLYLVFELVDTDLKKYMDSIRVPLSPDLVQSYTSQILEGLAYCHSMGVMHRDLKPQNILVTRDGGLKIADFGLARAFTPQHRPLTIEVITRWYRAPEILLGCNIYSSSVDLWSVGCILAEMSNKRAFLPGDSEIDQLHKIFMELGTPTPTTWPGVENHPHWRNSFPNWKAKTWDSMVPSLGPQGGDFLSKLFVYVPENRSSAEEALCHPFITRAYSTEGRTSSCTGQETFAYTSPQSTAGVAPIGTDTIPSAIVVPDMVHRPEPLAETAIVASGSAEVHRVTPDDLGTLLDDSGNSDKEGAEDKVKGTHQEVSEGHVEAESRVTKRGAASKMKRGEVSVSGTAQATGHAQDRDGVASLEINIQGDILAAQAVVTDNTHTHHSGNAANSSDVSVSVSSLTAELNTNYNSNSCHVPTNTSLPTATTAVPGKTRESKRKLSQTIQSTVVEKKNSKAKKNDDFDIASKKVEMDKEKEKEKSAGSRARMRLQLPGQKDADNIDNDDHHAQRQALGQGQVSVGHATEIVKRNHVVSHKKQSNAEPEMTQAQVQSNPHTVNDASAGVSKIDSSLRRCDVGQEICPIEKSHPESLPMSLSWCKVEGFPSSSASSTSCSVSSLASAEDSMTTCESYSQESILSQQQFSKKRHEVESFFESKPITIKRAKR